jgi:hypothetical protein
MNGWITLVFGYLELTGIILMGIFWGLGWLDQDRFYPGDVIE